MAGRKRGPPPGAEADDLLVKRPHLDVHNPDAKVTLLAGGRRFAVQRDKLAAVSDCFRAMFSNGMRETKQQEISLGGVSAMGLEKTLEVVDTGNTTLKGKNVLSLMSAATYLQVTPVIEFCERALASRLTASNFFQLAKTAEFYCMKNALQQIDKFVAKNLRRIAKKGTLCHVTYDQMQKLLSSEDLRLPEVEVFFITRDWLAAHPDMVEEHAQGLLRLIRYRLINPADLVLHVEKVDVMTSDQEMTRLVMEAFKYHVLPHSQPLTDAPLICPRATVTQAVCVTSAEMKGEDRTVVTAFDVLAVSNHQKDKVRRRIINLQEGLDGMEVVNLNDFLYLIGGMNTISFSDKVFRYDPRSNSWFLACPLMHGRYRFFAGALSNKVYAVGGDCHMVLNVTSAERYDPAMDRWEEIAPIPGNRTLHGGAVLGNCIYISGGSLGGQSTSDVLRYSPDKRVWERRESMLGPRGGHVICAARGKLFVFGGHCMDLNNDTLNETRSECYDPDTDQWTVLAPLHVPHDGSSWLLHDRYAWVIGGQNAEDCTDQKLVSQYDLDTDSWEVIKKWPWTLRTYGSSFCMLNFPVVQNNPAFLTPYFSQPEQGA
ncbi:hypothetical protein BaRGS_00021678 [Batillaria attramentaria]|uniref:BTB domain-containing protein n=1 Tax=Batillaria attramentaria TaxID=370345 RepID=A0ABD0KJ36_9CAEN|nr:hypothetical protein BaRGS_022125 [Batillaria attramentaria]